MSKVFVLDTHMRPLNPVHPGRARMLLQQGKAAIYRRYPFTIVLKTVISAPTQPLRLKLDPGSKTTGLAIVNDASGEVVFAAELTHRGQAIRASMQSRRAIRRNRRQRKTRYRKPRFQNRKHNKPGWLPPSLESRLANVLTWTRRLKLLCPLAEISLELVKFDTQRLSHPEMSGVQYQQGTLYGYEVREYLLEKWGRACAYCEAADVPLEVEHIRPRSKSHDDRVCNLTLACKPCNDKKGTQDIRDFLKDKPDLLVKLLAQAQAPLKDAAAVNAMRLSLYERLLGIGLPLECGSGGRTKFNRTIRGLPKTHWLDAACVGENTPVLLSLQGVVPLLITATGSGNRQMCGTNKYGFPIRHRGRKRRHAGFQTGDLVRAVVPSGKYAGKHTGRVLVRATGSFDIRTQQGRVQGISYRSCTPVQRCDGYSYARGAAA